MQELQKERDIANNKALEMLQKNKVCQFELEQCIAPFQDLKDIYEELFQWAQDSIAEWSFCVDRVTEHVQNLSQLCVKGARNLANSRRELREMRQIEEEHWHVKEADLMKDVAAKYRTYFQRGFEDAVQQFIEQGVLPLGLSLEFLDEGVAFKNSPQEPLT